MHEKQSDQSQNGTIEQELGAFFGVGGELPVTLEATEKPGEYKLHGTALTTRFVKISEAFPDQQRTPIDQC